MLLPCSPDQPERGVQSISSAPSPAAAAVIHDDDESGIDDERNVSSSGCLGRTARESSLPPWQDQDESEEELAELGDLEACVFLVVLEKDATVVRRAAERKLAGLEEAKEEEEEER